MNYIQGCHSVIVPQCTQRIFSHDSLMRVTFDIDKRRQFSR